MTDAQKSMATSPTSFDENEDSTGLTEIEGQHAQEVANNDVEADLSRQDSRPVYSVFSRRTRIFITVSSSLGALISPLSSTIYLPSLDALSNDFHVTYSKINLTLTCYSIVQAIAPAFYSDFADENGYRPAVIVSYVIYIGANIGLALQSSYGALVGLRAMQAAGASATVALSMGVLSAIVTPAERGTFLAYAKSGTMLAPSIGPILGGVLAQYLGWRSVFWFLTILSGVYIISYVILVPETNRKIVGNGSIPPRSLLNKNGLDIWRSFRSKAKGNGDHGAKIEERNATMNRRPQSLRIPRPWKTLTIGLNKDVGVAMYFSSILYAAYYAIVASMPTLFAQLYHYNELQIGLAFIPMGVGAVLGTMVNGKAQDWNFRRLAKKHNLAYDKRKEMDLRNFPLEQCRILPIIPSMLMAVGTLITYGFGLQYGAPASAALVQQFIMASFLTSSFSSLSTLLIDWFPTRSATIQSSSNLTRCLFGAGSSALITPILNAMGLGWGFTFVALVTMIHIPLLYLLVRMGPKWREERTVEEEQKHQEKAAEGEKS